MQAGKPRIKKRLEPVKRFGVLQGVVTLADDSEDRVIGVPANGAGGSLFVSVMCDQRNQVDLPVQASGDDGLLDTWVALQFRPQAMPG